MELNAVPKDAYAGYVVEDSDLEYSDCSEGSTDDEGFCQTHKNPSQQDLSSDDEFEKAMVSEVLSAWKIVASPAAIKASGMNSHPDTTSSNTAHTGSSVQGTSGYYDEAYFDSSESSNEEGGTEEGGDRQEGGDRRRRRGTPKRVKKLSNDELFYDPNMDEEDEKWVKRQRMAYHNVRVSQQLEERKKVELAKEETGNSSKDQATPGASDKITLRRSDAVLNCPACMVTLCLDCQRHDKYVNQYRAMFVLNCQIIRNEVLEYVPKPDKRSRKRQRKCVIMEESSKSDEADRYHPVHCSECNTEVAVVDGDEVFHFFNVLASAPT